MGLALLLGLARSIEMSDHAYDSSVVVKLCCHMRQAERSRCSWASLSRTEPWPTTTGGLSRWLTRSRIPFAAWRSGPRMQ